MRLELIISNCRPRRLGWAEMLSLSVEWSSQAKCWVAESSMATTESPSGWVVESLEWPSCPSGWVTQGRVSSVECRVANYRVAQGRMSSGRLNAQNTEERRYVFYANSLEHIHLTSKMLRGSHGLSIFQDLMVKLWSPLSIGGRDELKGT